MEFCEVPKVDEFFKAWSSSSHQFSDRSSTGLQLENCRQEAFNKIHQTVRVALRIVKSLSEFFVCLNCGNSFPISSWSTWVSSSNSQWLVQYTIEYKLQVWNILVRFCSCKFKWSCSAVRWGQTSQSPQASRIRWEKLVSCSLGFQNCCSQRMSNINCVRAVRLFFSSQKQKRLASDEEYSRVTHITKRQHPNDVRTFVFSTAWMHCSTDLCYRSQVQAKGKELQFHVVSIF